ncbi:MAG: glycosyltransferase family 4 protein [Desulfomonile tiedjei]|nr:glycosyltransferase family 4 protein [Desulfomonile tiedjei]
MKILHLSTWDTHGGAARAASRLHQGLQNLGADSRMLVQRKKGSAGSVEVAACRLDEKIFAKFAPALDRLPWKLYPRRGTATWTTGWFPNTVASRACSEDPSIIHIHWIGEGFLPLSALTRFRRPVVWSFHDAWPLTGGCHYPGSCLRYQDSCGHCPLLGSTRQWDLSRWIWSKKKSVLESVDLMPVTQSRWLHSCARASSLFRGREARMIPYGLDVDLYKPVSREFARHVLNLPQNKKIALMGAMNSTTDPRKGASYLAEAARWLSTQGSQRDTQLVLFGVSDTSVVSDWGLETRVVGLLHDDYSLVLLYSAADVFVAPSTEEAFGQTLIEAMACGTPCVAFDVGGIPDIIEDRRTGYLARPMAGEDLAKGISWVLEDDERRQDLSAEARRRVQSEYSMQVYARRYLALYEEILRKKRHS